MNTIAKNIPPNNIAHIFNWTSNFLSISPLLDLAENAEKYRTDPDAKPPFSYATIICLAMRANNNKVSLSNIYAWIRENFLFYKYADPAWQVKRIFIIPVILSRVLS